MKNSLFTTEFAKFTKLERDAKTAATALETKLRFDMTAEEYDQLLMQLNPGVETPISKIFQKMKQKKSFGRLSIISTITDPNSDIPEVLTIPEMSINGALVPAVTDIRFKGVWTSLNTMVKRPASKFGSITVASINEAMAACVRGTLMSTYDKDNFNWMSDKGLMFLIEFYGMSLEYATNRLFSWDLAEGKMVRYVFAYYYATLVDKRRDKKQGNPPILGRCVKLGLTMAEREKLNSSIANVVGRDKMNMTHVVTLLKQLGPAQCGTLKTAQIYRILLETSRSNIATSIAADYPPYLLWLILKTASHDKHPLFTNVINNRYSKREVLEILGSITNDREIY